MNKNRFYFLAVFLVGLGAAVFYYMYQDQHYYNENTHTGLTLTMYHGEGCACCVRWADYLEEHGITVTDVLLDDPHSIKNENQIPGMLRSCHTGIINGYVVEGHVPVEDILRLLEERPDAIGISVPGMPPNAPGMDIPVERDYVTILFGSDNMTVYNTHR